MALTPKQARFVEEYLQDLNATQAAVRAGYSAHTAEQQGSRLLRNAQVRNAVENAQARRAARVEVKSDDVLRELLRLAMVDIGEAFDEAGRLRKLSEMPPDVRRAISGVETTVIGGREEGIAELTKVKFWDKPKALELLGKHLKLFTEKMEVSGSLTLEQLVAASMKPPEGAK